MKKICWLMLSFMAFPIQAQSLLGTLNQHQKTFGSSDGTGIKKPDQEVKKSGEVSSLSSGKCEENDQTSLPLAYITSLIQGKDGKLEVDYDSRKGRLEISANDMINNCNTMIEWKLKDTEINGKRTYVVEAKLRQGGSCTEVGCEYKVDKFDQGELKHNEKMVFKPTLKGFEECLKQTGVVVGDKVVPAAINSGPMTEKMDGIEETGDLLFVSHGPSSGGIKAKYGKFDPIVKCDYYESLTPDKMVLYSAEDEEKERLAQEAAKLKDCGINEYYKVSDFLEKYEGYSKELEVLRDNLILQAAKKSAKNIETGKYTEEDLKVMEDFNKYIVGPKVENIKRMYAELGDLEGDAKKAKQAEIKTAQAELKSLNSKHYYLAAHTKKFIDDGRFEDAEKLNTMKLTLDAYSKLGKKVNNVVITEDVATKRVVKGRKAFLADMDKEKEDYEIKTGQVTGKEVHYKRLSKRMKSNIEVRTENFKQEILEEYARMQQPNGYCYKYFRNTQKCLADAQERIQELMEMLKHYNKVDAERAAEYDEKAKEYGKLEAEGRRYVAAQNGEDEEEAPKESAEDEDMMKPRKKDGANGDGSYSFQYNAQQGGQQQQQMPQQFQNPMSGYTGGSMFQQQGFNPYGGMGYQQQSHMGQQAYGGYNNYGYNGMGGMGGGAYNFQWGGGGQQQGMYGSPQQQGGYWGQPYQAYNNFSMYR